MMIILLYFDDWSMARSGLYRKQLLSLPLLSTRYVWQWLAFNHKSVHVCSMLTFLLLLVLPKKKKQTTIYIYSMARDQPVFFSLFWTSKKGKKKKLGALFIHINAFRYGGGISPPKNHDVHKIEWDILKKKGMMPSFFFFFVSPPRLTSGCKQGDPGDQRAGWPSDFCGTKPIARGKNKFQSKRPIVQDLLSKPK